MLSGRAQANAAWMPLSSKSQVSHSKTKGYKRCSNFEAVPQPESVSGVGVDLALKVLLLFFVGGAASCEKLLRCQEVDAGWGPGWGRCTTCS